MFLIAELSPAWERFFKETLFVCCLHTGTEVKGQLSEAGSLFLPWNVGGKLAQQAPLPAEHSLAQGKYSYIFNNTKIKSSKYENTIARGIILSHFIYNRNN